MGCCGYRCRICPALLATKDRDMEALAKCRAQWGRLLGPRHAVEQPPECEGCYNTLGKKANPNCAVRACCMKKGHITCAECPDYPCGEFRRKIVSRREIEKRLGADLPEDLYETYIKPLENGTRLDGINKRYGPDPEYKL